MTSHPTLRVGGAATDRPKWPAMSAGARGRCPACHRGRLFQGFLKVADACPACGQELHHHRADDAPPYFTIIVVGHVVVGGILMLEKLAQPPSWVQMALWLPATVILSLLLLPPIKGALVGLQWALRMHGFGDPDQDPARPEPIPSAAPDRPV